MNCLFLILFSFEDLLKEERTCSQEISAFEKKIETWSLAVKADPKLPPAPSGKVCLAKALEEDLPPEVTALERFLQQTGGKQGGWDQYDHQSFLKVWTKHNGKPAYRKEALLYLPGKTPEDVEQHEDWYLELLYLQEKKKEVDWASLCRQCNEFPVTFNCGWVEQYRHL